jgi:hypothetical protein
MNNRMLKWFCQPFFLRLREIFGDCFNRGAIYRNYSYYGRYLKHFWRIYEMDFPDRAHKKGSSEFLCFLGAFWSFIAGLDHEQFFLKGGVVAGESRNMERPNSFQRTEGRILFPPPKFLYGRQPP